jgi:hypothetical protein
MNEVSKLWSELNDPERFEHAARSTYDTLVWSLIWNDGWYDSAVRARLADLSNHQLADLIGTLKKHRVNPHVAAAIEDLLS